MKCCGTSGPMVETQHDFGLCATGPRQLDPLGPLITLARTGPTAEKLLMVFCLTGSKFCGRVLTSYRKHCQ